MFFGRSTKSLKGVLREHPDWRDPLARVFHAVERAPVGHIVDPSLIARLAHLSAAETIAYLQVFKEAGCGEFVARVVTEEGVEVAVYPRIADIPPVVEDEFGDELEVMPENIDLGFSPKMRPEVAQILGKAPVIAGGTPG